MADEAPDLPGPDAPAFWNGEPCYARRVTVVVADAPFPAYWAREFVGQERQAIEITYLGYTFYIDDEGYQDPHDEGRRQIGAPGWGWAKVTLGKGSPRYGHAQLEVSEVCGGRA